MKPISIAEPVTDLKRIKIIDNGEPLVDFLEACPELVMDRPRFDYRRETVIRKGVAERLCVAAAALPKGYRFAMVEGWRAPLIQGRMYAAGWRRSLENYPDWSHSRRVRFVNKFTAPMNDRVPPPHTTGGALDMALHNSKGEPVDFMAPFAWGEHKAYHFECEGLSAEAFDHRQIMKEALLAGGITNYPSEYWHYSFGDQGWAYRGGHDHALYGAITPEGWEPDPKDIQDGPLELMEDFAKEIEDAKAKSESSSNS